jgi:F-type H+-transporting ATPase subunit b
MLMPPLSAAATSPPVDYKALEGASSFPPFDVSTFTGQLIWLVLTFVPFYLVMSRLVLPKLQLVLDNRETSKSDGFALAAKAFEEAQQSATEHESTIAEARRAADAVAAHAAEEAKQQLSAHRKQIEAELSQKLADAELRIAEASAKAIRLVPDVAEEVAGELLQVLANIEPEKSKIGHAVAKVLKDLPDDGLDKA